MRKICLDKIFTFLLAGLLLFGAASGTASAFNLAGNTYDITKVPLNNTRVDVEEYSFGQGPPTLIGSYTNTSNATGYFNVQNIPDTPSSNFKIILRHFNATTGNLDYIGQSLPTFPYFETAQLAMGPPVDFYLKQGGTINLTATNGTYPQTFNYMVKDTRLGYPIVENFTTEVSNVTIYLPADRNYSIMIYPNRSFPVSFDLSSSLLNSTYDYVANVSFNTSNTLRKVSGYANLSDGSSNFNDLKIIAYLMEPGNMIFQDYPLPYNMSQWCQYGPSPCAGDVYNATTGYYNITLPGAAMTANILLFATAKNATGEYYGIFRNVSLDYSEEAVTNFNFTLQPLLGDEANISINNAGGGGEGPNRVNVTTKKLNFLLRNSSGADINNAHVEVEVDYSAYNGSAFNWMADVTPTNSGQFSIPAISANINKINIYTQGSAPLKTSKTAAQLAIPPVRINLSAFNPGAINISEGPPPIFIDMLKSTPLCDVPNPQAGCSLFPQQQDMSDFNPFKIVVGGGKISLRMRSNFNNITVHYKNVDMLASGPPDALFDSNATQSQNGSSMEHARRFGSMGPEIYDEVLIGIPLASGINANNVSVKFGKLYNENWGEVWNSSANTTGDLPSDYSAFNLSFFNPGGMQCSTINQNAACYVSITDRMVWVTIPHFSGVDTTVSGTSGNFTATLNSTALAGNKANLNFTLDDTANTTSWYNFTFQDGFDAANAIINSTINGTQDPQSWSGNFAALYVNVSTSDPAAVANIGTNQYINISNITVPSSAGNYTINVTTSNSLMVSLNYTVITYGANLTVDSNARTTTTSTNATYTLTLQNNGSTTDTYNLTIDNPTVATTATLNISGNITLTSNAVQILLLNVTNTTAGTFHVNVTARSNNDTSKFGYINTTTTVASYGANLTLSGAFMQTTNAGTNANYTLILQNNGTATDTYNLTIDNPGSASTAALNISGNITLASNSVQILLLNVTNNAGGNFPVNVTARSNNDSTKFGYINTSTTVAVRGVVLTNITALAQTIYAGTNATYLLNLTNNGSATDEYNLVIDNKNNALIADINITSPKTLASGLTQIIALNVTNTTAGTVYVNITATSVFDPTKFSYINTTTTVNTLPYIPSAPTSLSNTTGNFWVNHTWQAGTGNVTNSYNVSVNGTWANGTTNTFYNNTVGAHDWSNITVLAYNSSGSGSLNSTSVSQNTRVMNNVPIQTPIGNKNVTVGNVLSFTVSATDADSDIITYGTNASKGTPNPATGAYSWTPVAGDVGIYIWYFNSSDNYGVGGNETITVTVNSLPIPPAPANLANTTGNFWVNHTWQAGSGNVTNSYNVSVNGSWVNGTAVTYYNNTVEAHGWSNITVLAYNSSGIGSLNSTSVQQNTRVSNNAPSQSAIGNKNVTVGSVLSFTVSATDADSDTITYGTNASKGSLNPTTGAYSWTPVAGETGAYIWYFNSSDNYGGVGNETITVTAISYGVSLTNISVLTGSVGNTTPLPNATYAINLTNNGTVADSYTITINNPSGASTAALNITSPVSLGAGQTRIFSLNVTNNLSGTFNVNITARSDNDTTKFGYVNTTTTVNRTIVNTTIANIINTSTFIVNATLSIAAPGGNVTVTIPNGTNASVNGAALASISLDSLAQLNSTFAANLSSTNKFIGENLTLGPDGALFSPDIQIRFNFTAAQLTAAGIAESGLAVKFYNISTGAWESLTIYERNTTADYIIANASHFSTFALIGVPTTTTTTTSSSSGGGGGGGGGGGASAENYSNIIVREKYDMHIFKDQTTSYAFKNSSNPISSVDITGNVNAGEINTAVEVLRDTSILVKKPAQGIVYKNINIWVGTTGFAVPKNIKEAVIKFRVENSWMADNSISGKEITLLKWKNDDWNKLETKETGKNDTYTFFEGMTDSFSSFAISGIKNDAGSTEALISAPSPTETKPAVATPTETPGFEVILAVVTIGILYLSGRKR